MNTSTLILEEIKVKKGKVMSGAEAVLQSLIAEGVDTIFGYPGGAIMPIYDALYHYDKQITHYLVRHEQGATHAAQGYSRVTGKTGVCFATSGPGATNLITGIADAQIDSTPMVCITGQVASPLLGSDAFQETDVVGISMPVTKWNYQVTKAEEIPEAISRAFYIANSGRPGPVVIDITKDAQIGEFEFNYKKCERIRSYHPYPAVIEEKIDEAIDLIKDAKKPYLLIGHGILISKAQKELSAFVEKSGIPFASTLLGLSAMPVDHPLYMGYLGMHGNYGPNLLTNECDVLIAIGMRFDDRVTGSVATYAKQAKVIHVEIDPSEIDKNVKTTVAINSDAKAALIALTRKIDKRTYPDWLAKFKACDEKEFEKVIKDEYNPTSEKLRMGEVIHILSEKTKGSAILVTDVGQHQMVASRYYRFSQTDSNVTSGGLGTMGFALPAAMGAKIALPTRQVVAVIGDGGFQMTIQELGTISQYGVAVKVIVLNNNFLGMVRQWQQLFFDKRYSFTELKNPDFQMIAKGYGMEVNKVEHRENLDKAISDLLNHDGPYFLEVIVEKEGNVFPMVPSGASVSDIRLE
ncbi:MAG: biosynthetic-type acetolactate synthase large subunit [Bacteroidetes bacterium]|nr:biosynthetic-type acetolactate synthase large subunit [Bacteroidota bacterium]MDA1121340.1 biosynthetic-type acetolactate synthase large subunit [Bacteroidota bacterium]